MWRVLSLLLPGFALLGHAENMGTQPETKPFDLTSAMCEAGSAMVLLLECQDALQAVLSPSRAPPLSARLC